MTNTNDLYLPRDLLNSEGFKSLSKIATTVYLGFRMNCQVTRTKTPSGRKKEWVITNNGKIEYTYKKAEANGITRPRFQRAIDELVEKGFIDIERQGSGGIKGYASLYAISDRWKKWGTQDFEHKSRVKDDRKGRGWQRYWENKSSIMGNDNVNREGGLE